VKTLIVCLLVTVTACSAEDQPSRVASAKLSSSSEGNKPTPNKAQTITPTSTTTKASESIKPWDAKRCGDDDYKNRKMERHPDLMGLTAAQLLQAYGPPSADEKVKVGEPVGSFYGPFRKVPSSQRQKNFGDPLRILTWTKNKCNFSVFFFDTSNASSAVYAFEWSVGADF
jgi:hypothetical protein